MKNRICKSVNVDDLLRRPYERGVTDCSTVAFEVLGRLELRPRGAGSLEEIAGVALASMGHGMAGADVPVVGTTLDAATRLGDIVYTESARAPAGLLVLVDEGPPRVFLTALPGRGVVRLRASAIRGVTAVYRLRT